MTVRRDHRDGNEQHLKHTWVFFFHVNLARVTHDGRRLGRRIPKVAITAHRASQWSVVDSET